MRFQVPSRAVTFFFFFISAEMHWKYYVRNIHFVCVAISIGWSWMSLSVYTRPAIRLSILWLFWHISTWRCSNLPNKVIILLAKFFFTSNVYTVRKNPFGVHHRIIEALMSTWKNSSFVLVTEGICGCHPVGFNYVHPRRCQKKN